MCGADVASIIAVVVARGSSPRVRGRRCGGPWAAPQLRLIPACAGQASLATSLRVGFGAHPRVCGADCRACEIDLPSDGSSPRVRGRPTTTSGPLARSGLIPACAGQTSKSSRVTVAFWAHPRVCGADLDFAFLLPSRSGSSPRVRGRLCTDTHLAVATGLIPACAGQTREKTPRCPPARAHPRVCGADVFSCYSSRLTDGSSPRVRGRRHGLRRAGRHPGLIPACAGQTTSPPRA